MDNLQGRRILVLEEHAPVAALLVDMLRGLGCEPVGPVERIGDALALAGEEALDAAILDVAIKGEVSFAVADELIHRGIPYAFASGNKTPESIVRYAPVPIITKPYAAEHIQRVLSELIESAPG